MFRTLPVLLPLGLIFPSPWLLRSLLFLPLSCMVVRLLDFFLTPYGHPLWITYLCLTYEGLEAIRRSGVWFPLDPTNLEKKDSPPDYRSEHARCFPNLRFSLHKIPRFFHNRAFFAVPPSHATTTMTRRWRRLAHATMTCRLAHPRASDDATSMTTSSSPSCPSPALSLLSSPLLSLW